MFPKENPASSVWVQNLCRLMVEQGLNPRRLACKAGLNQTAVRDMIRGRSRSPRYSSLEAISRVLGVTPAVLMGEPTEIRKRHGLLHPLQEHIASLTQILAYLQKTALDKELGRDANRKLDMSDIEGLAKQTKTLTDKEKEVLTWVAIGKTDDEIGQILGLSKHTVNMHIRHIYEKIEANNRVFAVVKAISTGLINVKSQGKTNLQSQ